MRHIDRKTLKTVLEFQKNEITEHLIYRKLSRLVKNRKNSAVLANISKDELRHHNIWRSYTRKVVSPDMVKYWFYVIVSTVFGVTFGIKLMESGEEKAQEVYDRIARKIPAARNILKEESVHENQLIGMLDEEKLLYIGSVVLGLNDAIVELTGTLAGLTFAIRNARIIGTAGLITGIAAALSMAASEYLSTKAGEEKKNPLKASFYTFIAYATAVFFLILPYMLVNNYLLCLSVTLIAAVTMIFFFTYYYSVVREISFRERFLEMFIVSMGVALLSFVIGNIANRLLTGGGAL